jgi:hypothetical protein
MTDDLPPLMKGRAYVYPPRKWPRYFLPLDDMIVFNQSKMCRRSFERLFVKKRRFTAKRGQWVGK